MRILKLLVLPAIVAGILLLSIRTANASGCCLRDCDDSYANIIAAGIPLSDANAFLAECQANCRDHGTPDPSYCTVQGGSFILVMDRNDEISRALRSLMTTEGKVLPPQGRTMLVPSITTSE